MPSGSVTVMAAARSAAVAATDSVVESLPPSASVTVSRAV